jgi:hypothetical protein
MTTNKDFKQLVRARMKKTGESYTSARAKLLKPRTPTYHAPRTTHLLPPDYEKIAGLTDKVMKEKTGCPWERWVKTLDRQKAYEWDHTRLSTWIHEKFKVDPWWTQMTAVGYERLKGLRARGQRRGGTWGADKSKTVNAPVAVVFKAFTDSRQRAKWLPDATLRTSQPNRSVRLGLPDGMIAAVGLTVKGPAKTAVAVGNDGLPSQAAANAKKAYWAERLGALAALVGGGPA